MISRIIVCAFLLVLLFTPFTSNCQVSMIALLRAKIKWRIKKILIDGKFWVWTQKIGDGKINVLLLHGGPAQSHEYFEIFSKYLPKHGITIYYYDQFGSYFSQDPTKQQLNDTAIWKVSRYVEEIEQVRKGLNLKKFFIYGHSYGALLALAYTYKYQSHIKGMIFSDMNPYPADFDKRVSLASIKTDSILNESKLYHNLLQNKIKGLPYDTSLYGGLFEKAFTRNFLIRLDSLPGEIVRTKEHKNFEVAQKIGPSTFSLNYAEMIPKIYVPVLLVCGQYDFIISSEQIKNLSTKFSNAQYYIVPNGGHICFIDNPEGYFPCLIRFIKNSIRLIDLIVFKI